MSNCLQQVLDQLHSPVAVLYGGTSQERDVSLNSGKAVMAALTSLRVPYVAVDTQGDWIQVLRSEAIKHALIFLHGGEGEDGTVQAVLDTLGISYAGSGVEASAVAMDKVRSKQVWVGQKIPTAPGMVADLDDDPEDILANYGPSVIVKPAHEGSSVGMAIAHNAEQLSAAIADAWTYDSVVLVESLLSGPEYTVAILGQQCLPAIRLEPDGAFYDYQAKYVSEQTHYHCPAGLSDEDESRLASLAKTAFDALGCEGWGRVDIMAHEGRFYVLEVNTIPGMTDHSLVPKAAAAAGMDFPQLVLTILAESLGVEVDYGR